MNSNERKNVPLKGIKGIMMRGIVILAGGSSPQPEEASSHVKRCTMSAIKPGNGSISCL